MFEKLMGRLDPDRNSRVFKAVSKCYASSCASQAHSKSSNSKSKKKKDMGDMRGVK